MDLDFGRAIKYIFEDKELPTKALITAAISLVPILNFAVSGYQVELMRNIWAGEEYPLPDWDDLARKFMLGLPLGILSLVLMVPVLLLVLFFILVLFLAILPATSLSAAEAESKILALLPGMVIFIIIFVILLVIYVLLINFLRPAWLIRYAKTGDWHSFLEIRELLKFIRERFRAYVLAILAVIIASWLLVMISSVASISFSFIPFVGSLAAIVINVAITTFITFFSAQIYAQVAETEPS